MNKLLLGSVALLAAVAGGPAAAADLSRPIYKAPPAAPPVLYSWTGVYAGISLGGQFSRNEWTTTAVGVPPRTTGPDFNPANVNASLDQSRFRLGGYLGYNVQLSQFWVVGAEFDIGTVFNSTKSIVGVPG